MCRQMAFDDEKPFPRRRAIAAKQAVYLNLLKERLRRRELYGRVPTDTEQIVSVVMATGSDSFTG